MNLKTLILSLLFVLTCTSASAKGRIPIVYSSGEEIEKVFDLPLRDEFTLVDDDGSQYHGDLGILHEQFSVFWIPLYNYGTPKYVLYTEEAAGEYDYLYIDLEDEDIAYLQGEFGGIPSSPELPFWDVYGGKLLAIFLLIVLGIIFS